MAPRIFVLGSVRTSHDAQRKQWNHIDEDAKIVQLGEDLYSVGVVGSP